MNLFEITDNLVKDLERLQLDRHIPYVYNPLIYAREPYDAYLRKYGESPKEVVLLGMNPGPWGMAQTGIPFGEVKIVGDWMNIREPIGKPAAMHPKRPVEGLDCKRSEVSGTRLWGWARDRFVTSEMFFKRFFVANYCPLIFFDSAGKNITPDKLPVKVKDELFPICDSAILEAVEYLKPDYALGIGRFAADRAAHTLNDVDVTVGRILHPSPANPRANSGWREIMEGELMEMGIELPESDAGTR
jgi:single-strand selective monofunctional uracil DNA glycosylase